MIFVSLFLIGAVTGVLSGLFGIGGGVIIVPALIVFLGFSPQMASGTSLAAMLPPVGLGGVINYKKHDFIDIKGAVFITIGIFTGALFGALISVRLDPSLMKKLYGVFLLWMSYRFIDPVNLFRKNSEHRPENYGTGGRWFVLLPIGLVAGVFSGLFGIGGGAIIVPALTFILKYRHKRAVGTSLAALLLPSGLLGAAVYYRENQLNILYAVMIAAGLWIGAFFGSKLSIKLNDTLVKRMYGFFVLILSLYFLII